VSLLSFFCCEKCWKPAGRSLLEITQTKNEQEHSESANLRQGGTGPDPNDFQNLLGTSLSIDTGTSMVKFSWTSDHFLERYESYEPNCRKIPLPCLRIFANPRSGSIHWWLPKFNQFFFVYRYTSGEIFMKIRSVVLHEVDSLTDRQTNRQKETPRIT